MKSPGYLVQLILFSEILHGSANPNSQSSIFRKCCDSGKNWFHSSEYNKCDSFPRPQLLSNLGSLSYDGNTDYLVSIKRIILLYNSL